MTAGSPDTPFGVYVHIPFCRAKCDYCAFATWTDRHHLTNEYVAAVADEIRSAVDAGMPVATSIFVGGGTPSMLDPALLEQLLEAIPTVAGSEVTIECNPDDVTPELMRAYSSAGVNRVSLGVQSMAAHVLCSLGRTHDRRNVERSIAAVRAAGIPTFNLDLIYGAAGETVGDWEATVASVVALEPPHVSAYALTIEPGTPLAAQPDRHPDD